MAKTGTGELSPCLQKANALDLMNPFYWINGNVSEASGENIFLVRIV
jgi:hypothetical protein